MARIRSVKPEFWDDRKLARRTSRDARLLYIALWNIADEHARLNGDPQWIKGQAFAFDDDLDADAIEGLLKELEGAERIVRYEADDDPYIFLPNLRRHQRLEPEKVKSRLPEPPASLVPSESCADEYAPGADSSGSGADEPALLYGAGSRGQVAGGRGTRGARPASMLGVSLLDEHLGELPARPPREVIADLSTRIEAQIAQGATDKELQEALRRMRLKNLGFHLLPSLVNEVRQEHAGGGAQGRASPPVDRREAAAQAQTSRAMQRARQREGTT